MPYVYAVMKGFVTQSLSKAQCNCIKVCEWDAVDTVDCKVSVTFTSANNLIRV